MTGKTRASIFDEEDDQADIDITGFAPKPPATPAGPSPEKVRAVSEAANFRSREARTPLPPAPQKQKREPRRYRTGRNVQFNCKASQESIDSFYAIAEKQNWVLGYTLERALAALARELETT